MCTREFCHWGRTPLWRSLLLWDTLMRYVPKGYVPIGTRVAIFD